MVGETRRSIEFSIDAASVTLDAIQQLAAGMWSDLAFDVAALRRLKRDGLVLDGVRMTGHSPFEVSANTDGGFVVTVADSVAEPLQVETLLDLWRLHFIKGLRPGSLAA